MKTMTARCKVFIISSEANPKTISFIAAYYTRKYDIIHCQILSN
jgi:hypothetical protein